MNQRMVSAFVMYMLWFPTSCKNHKDEVDYDGDLATADIDCDDSNPDIHPWAEESCDGIDNDCDGITDEYATVLGENDDCDGTDSDCDGFIDEDGIQSWHPDMDGDGDVDMNTTIEGCEAPEGYDRGWPDCDDSDPLINSRTFELCGDGEDDDCDGVIDEVTSCMNTIVRGDLKKGTSGGSIGAAFAGPVDLDADSREDLVVLGGLISTSDAWVYVWYEEPPYGDVQSDTYDAALYYGMGRDEVQSKQNITVVESSGLASVAIVQGFPSTNIDTDFAPGIVMFTPFPITGDGNWEEELTASWVGESHKDAFGCSVDDAGDVNGDGFNDLLIGAIGRDVGGGEEGSAYLVYGPFTGDVSATDIDTVVVGQNEEDLLGWTTRGVGDMDGDGFDDVAISAIQDSWEDLELSASSGTVGSGYVTIFQDAPSGVLSPNDADAFLYLAGYNKSQLGYDIEAGDLDGDGYTDLIVSAPVANMVFVIPNSISGAVNVNEMNHATLTAEGSVSDALGRQLDISRDSDGDGQPELLLVLDGDGTDSNSALVVSGPFEGTFDLPNDAVRRVVPVDAFPNIGSLGDLDGDGLDEIGVGIHTSFEDSDGEIYSQGLFGILGESP